MNTTLSVPAISRQPLPDLHDSEICFAANEDWIRKPPLAERAAIDFLAHRIARSPHELLLHVQRIRLQCRRSATDDVYGALLDLFIVLGDKGLPLRRRLLKSVGRLLREDQRSILIAGLRRGIRASDPVPHSIHSRLTGGLSGTVQLVEALHLSSVERSVDPVIEARDLLDCSQIDAARYLLEQHLLQAPQRAELSQELLAIYRHTRNYRDFKRLYAQLKEQALAARDDWEALSRQFEQWQTEDKTADE